VGSADLGSDPARWPGRLRVGTHLAANATLLAYQHAVAEFVGRYTGLEIDFVMELSYESCMHDVNDVCFVCGLAYVVFERLGYDLAIPVAAPILSGDRYRGRPIYFSDVIVHADSGIHDFLGLRGRSWAFNEPLSQSGYGITRFHLARLGYVDGFFGEVVEAGYHHEAIRMVASGAVDGAAIDSHVLALEMRDHPSIARDLTVVDALGPSTIQPVAVSRRIPYGLRVAIAEALFAMASDADGREVLASAEVQRFVAVDGEAYDDVRAMYSFCESAGFLELR
jgi:phosphonate transport system substrate-binding protein